MVIKHSTVHNPNEIVPSADWNADHTGTASPEAHTLASHSTKAHAELTNVTSDQHHAQSHNMASHTDDYSAGGGIDISVGNVISGEDSTAANKGIVIVAAGEGMNVGYAAGTATVSGEDATTANKGIASFNTFDFSVAAGAVSLDDDIISIIDGDAGTATGLGHKINILGGEGINTSGLNDDITISGEDATTANKGIASFDAGDFNVAAGAVSLKVAAVSPPIGSVIAWLKTYTNTPALPTGWVECAGQTLSDAGSVYNGQVIPDLNGDNRFLRGNATSGGTGGSSTHTLTEAEMPAHTHNFEVRPDNSVNFNPPSAGYGTDLGDFETSSAGGSGAHENKPPYYDVVWIMRVK